MRTRTLAQSARHPVAPFAKASAETGQKSPARGPPLHVPSDSPGRFSHRNASQLGTPVLSVGLTPSARSGGLHQALSAGAPLPLRLVSITKCAPPVSADSSLP